MLNNVKKKYTNNDSFERKSLKTNRNWIEIPKLESRISKIKRSLDRLITGMRMKEEQVHWNEERKKEIIKSQEESGGLLGCRRE